MDLFSAPPKESAPEDAGHGAEAAHLPPIRLNGEPRFYRCEPGWSWAPGPLQDYDVWLVLNGHGTITLDNRTIALSAGSGFVFAPGSAPRGTQDETHRLRVFACHFSFTEAAPAPWQKTREFVMQDGGWINEMARRAAESYALGDAVNREQSRKLIETLLGQIEVETAPKPDSTRTAVSAAVARIAAAIREAPGEKWQVARMSREAGLSPSQFTRKFTEQIGAAPAHFVILTRLERARQLLRETDMTISAIAHALGYHDVHFFCRQFKNFTGVTPGSLRK